MYKTRTKVVIINGAPRSGKDTFVQLATDYCNIDESAHILNISSVDPIKNALTGFGWSGEKTHEIRDILSGIKKIWIVAQNGPTMFMMNNILQFHMTHVGEDNIVFCHIREPEEITKLVNAISGMDIMGIEIMTLFVIREPFNNDIDNNDSDDFDIISKYPYDVVIHNDGDLAQYDEKVCTFIDNLLKEDK